MGLYSRIQGNYIHRIVTKKNGGCLETFPDSLRFAS